MKKTKWIALCLLLLTASMLFSACGQPTVGIKKAFDGDKFSNPVLTVGNTVDALTGTTYVESDGPLAYFMKAGEDRGATHLVYNIETNAVVYTGASSAGATIKIDLITMDYGMIFEVRTVPTNPAPGQVAHRAIYAETGSLIAEADSYYPPQICVDLIYFDGKVYRMAEDGTIAFDFDWPSHTEFPDDITTRLGKFYIAADGWESIRCYDTKLNYVSTLEVPSYAVNLQCAYLSSDKILVQYIFAEPDDAEDYTFIGSRTQSELGISSGTKYTLKTMIYTIKSDKFSEVEFDHYITSAWTRAGQRNIADWDKRSLIDKYDGILYTYPIVDKRIDNSTAARQIHFVTKAGKISTFKIKALGDAAITGWTPIAKDRWLISTTSSRYLVNEKGTVIADVSNVVYRGDYLCADGKLYNMDFEIVLDYEAAGLRLVDPDLVTVGSMLLRNNDGELICFANGTQTTLIAKDSQRKLCDCRSKDFFIICDSSVSGEPRYEIYNASGTKLLDLTGLGESVRFSVVTQGENGERLIVCLNGHKYDDTYYRLG